MPEVKRKIIVEVGYYDFVFSDLTAANAFAYVAKTHQSENDSDRVVRITVDYEREEKQDEEEQDD